MIGVSDTPPPFWGSFDDAERLRRWAFLRRTPAERLDWLIEMLEISYRMGTLALPGAPDIERFVRETLGCGCPDEVFQSIEVADASTTSGTVSFTRLVIGQRLLIHVWRPATAAALPEDVQALAAQGCAERDARGYNRYRLVIATAEPEGTIDAVAAAFTDVVGDDDRAHVHVVAASELAAGLSSPGRHSSAAG
jgi:hypothetical protein